MLETTNGKPKPTPEGTRHDTVDVAVHHFQLLPPHSKWTKIWQQTSAKMCDK
jgi:hypothetical protein